MTKAIEKDFPFEQVDYIAEKESWRKEIYRPIYSIHKWWAKRLGSVFRAIVLGSVLDREEEIWDHFYDPACFKGKVVLDPFMGSGTSLGEAAKLGMKPIGCDINPVSTFIVRQALTRVCQNELKAALEAIERDVAPEIKHFYRTLDTDGTECEVLYYFWVKLVETPDSETIPLFSNYVFSKNAYASRKPQAKIVCPSCWSILEARYDSTCEECPSCEHEFNPQRGSVTGQYVTDSKGNRHKIKELVKNSGKPPAHRMYAILALRPDGQKVYIAPTEFDKELFRETKEKLNELDLPLPDMGIRDGHNTKQAKSYNYLNWKDFFNERQLLCLGLLLRRILRIEKKDIREAFLCLFSGTLEFNNMFCSFKGEGTGAVRHLFSHHILKPERIPLENNVWGTSKSSGSFTSLFRSRLIKAKEYLDSPFEIAPKGETTTGKVFTGDPLDLNIVDSFEEFAGSEAQSALILNGDSARLPIPNESVDAVITDPPYFDFIHYSELSDFFYAWLKPALTDWYQYFSPATSGADGEVQQKDPFDFARNLGSVFQESHRVLIPDGVLVFSFHHSRAEGWLAIFDAIRLGNFTLVASHPVKAEMAVSSPKSGTKEPINLDALLVCKKVINEKPQKISIGDVLNKTAQLISRMAKVERNLSSGDVKVILASQLLVFAARKGLSRAKVEEFLTEIFSSCPSQILTQGFRSSEEPQIEFSFK
ncbi:DNA methyltransferase [Marinobacter sp.]|uniref:DNA methyltransferase n=1 Tax=Marinobacter sp. TaxID=50741 RepID=UPI0035C75792